MTAPGVHGLLQLCEEALARPLAERDAWLDSRCAGNPDMRRAVAALLAQAPHTAGFLDTPAFTPERRHLSAGTRLGPYEVQSLIGVGGMGEVYKARDTRLGRTVALKLLPAELAGDADRRRRFEQEARAVSALNHPHICTLHDVSEHRSTGSGQTSLFLVMEYLAGETLAERLAKGALPIAQAMTIGVEITDALAVAHRQGIIHRDLKPANVMLAKNGAKLLDFGLAKLTEGGEPSTVRLGSDASCIPLTVEGTIAGTLPYMAPEQVAGSPVDARTDLWAVGAMVYEMVTGKRAFDGASAASVMVAILERDVPPLSNRQPLTPAGLDRLVRQCLSKLPDDRPDTAHDVANELRRLRDTGGPSAATDPQPNSRRWRIVRSTGLLLACAVATAILTSSAWAVLRPRVSPPPVAHTDLRVWPADELNAGGASGPSLPTAGGSRTALTWSPDGRSVIFVGRRRGVQQLYIRPLDAGEAHSLAGTEGAQVPAVSPDGYWVAFWALGTLKKMPLGGGPVTEIASGISLPPTALFWDHHGSVFFGKVGGAIWRISPGGVPTAVAASGASGRTYVPSSLLPDDRAILYSTRKRVWTWGDEEVFALDLATGQSKPLLVNAADARYVPTGHLVFLRQGALWAVPFDPVGMELTGQPVRVLDDVTQALTTSNTNDLTGAGQFAIASTGWLAWIPGVATSSRPDSVLVSVDRLGRVSNIGSPARSYGYGVRVSPQERKVVMTVHTLSEVGLWLYDLGRPGGLTALHRGGEALWAIWSPDGQRVVFESADDGRFSLQSQLADDSAPPEVLATGRHFVPSSWAPGGELLGVMAGGELARVAFGSKSSHVESLHQTTDLEEWPEISPDGHWLAYGSNASGRFEIYVQPYPSRGAAQPVSIHGGGSPAWHPGGHELFYVSPPDPSGVSRMMVVDFDTTKPWPPRIGTPRELFSFDHRKLMFACSPTRCYDVAPNGQRFYAIQKEIPSSLPVVTHINLVQNWLSELEAKVPSSHGK